MVIKNYDIVTIGGCGHVGAPLSILFASKRIKTIIYDINKQSVQEMNRGRMWFYEPGCSNLLKKALQNNLIKFSTDPNVIGQAKFIIVCIGTSIDGYGNPKFKIIDELILILKKFYQKNQIIILRSTVYPGTTQYIQKKLGQDIKIAFCPERIAEGLALKEFSDLPQIIASPDADIKNQVKNLFKKINKDIYEMNNIKEAELVKIFCNCYRYINFAIPNQLYMIAQRQGIDFNNIYNASVYNYPRMKGFFNKGFVGGTCLYKDTMQLNAFHNNYFTLGQAAMFINEGMPNFVVEQIENQLVNLQNKTAGILGMTYKADIDDVRESLSFKLLKLLQFKCKKTYWHDPFLKNHKNFTPFKKVLKSDIVILATPHFYYLKRKKQLRKLKNFFNATYQKI